MNGALKPLSMQVHFSWYLGVSQQRCHSISRFCYGMENGGRLIEHCLNLDIFFHFFRMTDPKVLKSDLVNDELHSLACAPPLLQI